MTYVISTNDVKIVLKSISKFSTENYELIAKHAEISS
jgi:hypothetical protein